MIFSLKFRWNPFFICCCKKLSPMIANGPSTWEWKWALIWLWVWVESCFSLANLAQNFSRIFWNLRNEFTKRIYETSTFLFRSNEFWFQFFFVGFSASLQIFNILKIQAIFQNIEFLASLFICASDLGEWDESRKNFQGRGCYVENFFDFFSLKLTLTLFNFWFYGHTAANGHSHGVQNCSNPLSPLWIFIVSLSWLWERTSG